MKIKYIENFLVKFSWQEKIQSDFLKIELKVYQILK